MPGSACRSAGTCRIRVCCQSVRSQGGLASPGRRSNWRSGCFSLFRPAPFAVVDMFLAESASMLEELQEAFGGPGQEPKYTVRLTRGLHRHARHSECSPQPIPVSGTAGDLIRVLGEAHSCGASLAVPGLSASSAPPRVAKRGLCSTVAPAWRKAPLCVLGDAPWGGFNLAHRPCPALRRRLEPSSIN